MRRHHSEGGLQRRRSVTFQPEVLLQEIVTDGDAKAVSEILELGVIDDLVNKMSPSGLTALHQSAIDGNLACAKTLVAKGANVNRTDCESWTPLHAAVMNGSVEFVRFLLASGADASLKNESGETPYDMAKSGGIRKMLLNAMSGRSPDADEFSDGEYSGEEEEEYSHAESESESDDEASLEGGGSALFDARSGGQKTSLEERLGLTPATAEATSNSSSSSSSSSNTGSGGGGGGGKGKGGKANSSRHNVRGGGGGSGGGGGGRKEEEEGGNSNSVTPSPDLDSVFPGRTSNGNKPHHHHHHHHNHNHSSSTNRREHELTDSTSSYGSLYDSESSGSNNKSTRSKETPPEKEEEERIPPPSPSSPSSSSPSSGQHSSKTSNNSINTESDTDKISESGISTMEGSSDGSSHRHYHAHHAHSNNSSVGGGNSRGRANTLSSSEDEAVVTVDSDLEPDSLDYEFQEACLHCDVDRVAKLLRFRPEIDVDRVNKATGITALHHSVLEENFALVQHLVRDFEADLHVQDIEGWTPLHAASAVGNIQIAQFLLDRGAKPSGLNLSCEFPVDVAEDEAMEKLLKKAMLGYSTEKVMKR